MVVSCRNYDAIVEAFCNKMPLLFLWELIVMKILEKLGLSYDKGKTYAILYYITAIMHILYMTIFIVEKNTFLARLNAVLVIFYLLVGTLIMKADRYGGIFTACTIAMTAFLVIHYVILGPSFGFQYLSIGMIPFMFYLAYVNGAGVDIAKKGSFASYLALIIVTIACSKIDYSPTIVSEISRRIIVFANLTLTFSLSIRFMSEFVNRTYQEADQLENKNLDLEKSANIDALTGLLNRRSIEKYIDRAFYMAKGEGADFSFLMCDIDNFKHVNDTYGHDCGDQILKNIASIIKSEVRPEDLVFRWGGEEIFIIINAGGYVAKAVAERCRKAIEESSVVYENKEIKVTITIGGVAYYQGADRDELINRADKNLYEGKQNGKNQVVM